MKQEEDYEVIHDPEENVEDSEEVRPEMQFSKQESRWIALGALKAALMIGSVYMIVLGLVIWLMLKIWL